MAVTIATVNTSTDTFNSWINKTNDIISDMSSVVVTTENSVNGGQTSGNAHVTGILSGSTLVAGSGLRGGSVAASSTLNIVSGVNLNPASASTFDVQGSVTTNVNGNLTVTGSGKTFTVNNTTTNLQSATTNITSSTLSVGAGVNTTFAGNLNVTGTANIGTIAVNGITASANSTINATLTVTEDSEFTSTGAITIPVGTELQRPAPVTGMIRFNTDDQRFEGYDSANWASIGGGAEVSNLAPSVPLKGDLWYDTSLDVMKVYEGTVFVQIHPLNVTATDATISKNVDIVGNLDVDGTIVATGDITAFSDQRLKENVITVDNALDKVSAMRGVYYNKVNEVDRKLGVIAQEIEEVIPEVVMDHENGFKSVAYANIVGVLIEAIKELKAEVEEIRRG